MTESQILDGVNNSATSSKASSPVPSAPNAPRYGTVIPNRIFVGGVAFNTSEAELKNFFSSYGHVKETKIIADRAGVSKGYGFVTFESEDEARRILKEQPNSLIFKDKKLNIGQAIRKQPTSFPKNVDPGLIPNGTVLHSPLGYSYTCQNGMFYFNQNEMQAASQGHSAMAHHTHTPHHQTPAYAPYTIPVMMPTAAAATSHHQYVTTQQQQQQPQQFTTYPPPVSSAAPQWTQPQPQWRWVHPSQLTKPITAGSVNGGQLVSPIYAAAPSPAAAAAAHASAAAAAGDGMVYASPNIYQSPEAAIEAVPMMEPAPAEGAVIAATTDQVQVSMAQPPPPIPPQFQAPPPIQLQPPPPGIMRPYYTTADFAYTDPAAFHALMQPRAAAPPLHGKFPAKRPIKMHRHDRAPKAFRTGMDGMAYAVNPHDDVSSGEN
ncbi:uncharacterized protein [Amphiura filiformis]|uniref:uncharacterized protein isoform X1 n=1 Tax=Amphiura filiformis TaxID=82378 RepID=UPI003B20F272